MAKKKSRICVLLVNRRIKKIAYLSVNQAANFVIQRLYATWIMHVNAWKNLRENMKARIYYQQRKNPGKWVMHWEGFNLFFLHGV